MTVVPRPVAALGRREPGDLQEPPDLQEPRDHRDREEPRDPEEMLGQRELRDRREARRRHRRAGSRLKPGLRKGPTSSGIVRMRCIRPARPHHMGSIVFVPMTSLRRT